MKSILISSLVLLGLVSIAFGSGHGFKESYLNQILAEAVKEQEARLGEEEVPSLDLPRNLNCGNIPGSYPTSVHQLRPHDIEVIGAIGDSLTAANGAGTNSILFLVTEYRGMSWCIGCQNQYPTTTTFATILKQFSPNLYGCSTGNGKQNSSVAFLNLADPGDTSFDMPGQARLLVQRIRQTVPNADAKWKVIQFFIGGNDLCDSCRDSQQTPENFVKNIRDTLDYFKAELPRTLVNLVLTLDVTGIEVLDGLTCRNMQNSFCDCGLSSSWRANLLKLTESYQKDTQALIDSGRYDTSDLFTVVLHKFMTKMTPPKLSNGKPDFSYFAPDCFHFSEKGHQAAAIELWNSVMTPHHARNDKWTIGQAIKCPTLTSPHFFTYKNSKSSLLSKLANN
jgi:phospholipase B1